MTQIEDAVLSAGVACGNAADRNATDHRHLMAGMSVLHLEFTVRTVDALAFGDQPGSALRGGLYGVLADKFCGAGYAVATPEHRAVCPVCRLLAAEDAQARRGRNLPRPLTVEPPLGANKFAAGTNFRFGVSLIGWAQSAVVYVLRAVAVLGRQGIGRARGRFEVTAVRERSPLTNQERLLVENGTVRRPQFPVTSPAVDTAVAGRASGPVRLELLTPMRLTSEGRLVKQANPVVLIQRLLERCQNLSEHFAVNPPDAPPIARAAWVDAYHALGEAAQSVRVVADDTYWVEARSGSQRQQRYTEIGGLVGAITLEGDVAPLLPWLYWGQSLHVGKDAVKGNGWFTVQ